jgi:hypothetical protein
MNADQLATEMESKAAELVEASLNLSGDEWDWETVDGLMEAARDLEELAPRLRAITETARRNGAFE